MEQFMDEDDSGEEIEIDSDPEFPAELFAYGDPFAIPFANPISSDDSNHYGPGDITDTSFNTNETPTYDFSANQVKLINDFNSKFSESLLKSAGTGDLLALLRDHWKTYVPICFNVSDNPLKNLIETETYRILLEPLAVFICNDPDCDKVLAELKNLEDPPQLCGKVFKAGEPSYFCRECGVDPTCVLCSSCFLKSEHRYHKYKMTTSGGGGYCDCGDSEAWKTNPCCELHMPKSASQNTSPGSYASKLPQDLIDRTTQLFGFLLDYIFEMLSIEKDDQLPSYLKSESYVLDDYVTMLYNDEEHSYDDVTGTLRKVLLIDDKKALEFAAVVDKEGRSAIKRGKKTECQTIKEKIEKKLGGPSKDPLDTKVLHHSLVAHQYFAEKLLVWLQKICDSSKGLKQILCKLGLFVGASDGHSLVEKLMLADTTFWKSARQIMHQFYISIYFMDPESKKDFSVLYTKNYRTIWRNYVKNPDDSVSLTDLAVQMFTVISLAKYLMENYKLMQMIMDTLIEHSKTIKGKLSFPRRRSKSNPEFKRAQSILQDLKYCLTAVPTEWTESLRKNFILGFKSFVDFLKFMHGMDSLVRQTQQHIEYEPEWETSFNLLIKLQRPMSALIDWCSSDQLVFLECYKYLLMAIGQSEVDDPQFRYVFEKKKLGDKVFEIIDCAVIKQEISIHAPLTRLFAALYSRIGKFSIDFSTFAERYQETAQPSLFITKHNTDKEKMISVLEPSIRSLVLVSQSTAGLWKRNGFSLLSQVYFYSNIKCRHDMFDRDVLCLQMGASVMDADSFIVNLLTHYNLFEFFTEQEFDLQATSQLPVDLKKPEVLLPISEDFLELLIHIICERYEPELSQIDAIDKIEREVVQQLCISPMPHSDLVKNIYSDIEKSLTEHELNTVLSKVAVFRNPRHNSSEKGVYELKDEYRKNYSPYFYHYIKSEKTKSEEEQLSQIKLENDKFFRPCELPKLKKPFEKIDFLLSSDTFIQIVFCVLKRALSNSSTFSDGQLAKILHLIGLAFHREKQEIDSNSELFNFISKTCNNDDENLLILLKRVQEMATTAEQFKLLCNWLIDYGQILKRSKFSKMITDESSIVQARTSNSPPSDSGGTIKDKRKSNVIAEKRRAKILAQLNKQQKNFMQNNKVFFEEAKSNSPCEASTISTMDVSPCQIDIVCLGPNQTLISPENQPKRLYQCILCQEEEEITLFNKTMVLCCYTQFSKVLSSNNTTNSYELNPVYMKNSLNYGINTSSCGHVMCAACWQKYVDTFRLSENRRHARYLSYNIKDEYSCPLCDTVGNCVMPLFPDFRKMNKQNLNTQIISLSYGEWLDGLEKTLDKCVSLQKNENNMEVFNIDPCPLSTITKLMADAVAYNFKSLFEFDSFTHLNGVVGSCENKESEKPYELSSEALKIMQNFNRILIIKLGALRQEISTTVNPDKNNTVKQCKPLSTMINCAYTIQCIERCLQIESKSLFDDFSVKQSNLLLNIVKESAFSSIYPVYHSSTAANADDQSSTPSEMRKICIFLLAALLRYKSNILNDTPSIIEIDLFHFLVYLCVSIPNLYQDTSNTSVFANNWQMNYLNIFQLTLQAHCVQIILVKLKNKKILQYTTAKSDTTKPDDDKLMTFYNYILEFFLKLNSNVYTQDESVKLESISIHKILKEALMPFIRNSALFFSSLMDLKPNARITSNPEDLNENFEAIMKFLGMPVSLSAILDLSNEPFKSLADFWLSKITPSKLDAIKIDYPLTVKKLIELPNDYIDLISMSMSSNVCHSKTLSSLMDTESTMPTYICLICGEKLCGQSYCCSQEIGSKRVGSCTAHAFKCGSNVGMFLRVTECQVLLLHLNNGDLSNFTVRGCFLPAPYVDDYGETDQYLKRGNPLKLCKSRYEKLYMNWLTHSIPDVISRKYQSDSGIYHTDWIQL